MLKRALKLKEEAHLSGDEQTEYLQFLQRSLRDYPADKLFQKRFYQTLGLRNEPEKENTMNLTVLKLIRMFHLISKEKYNQKRQIELVKASSLFDTKWYLAQNPDVKARKMSAARHYVKYGWQEGRNPSPKFDGNQYLADYPEVAAKGICPLVHYLISGRKEGRCYSSVSGEHVSLVFDEMNWRGRLRYALEYPLRLQEECDRLKAEIKALEQQMK